MTETCEQMLARELSFHQWEFLADHFEGSRMILANESPTRCALASRKLIRIDHPAKTTTLTRRGHAVMCAAMGLMADVLVRAKYDGMEKRAYGPITTPARHAADGADDQREEGRPV